MILVTGGCGAMGSVLVRELHKRGELVRVCVAPGDPFVSRISDAVADICYADIAKKVSLAGICRGIKTVYHLAAIIVTSDEGEFDRVNVEGTRNIVEEAHWAGVQHFIYVSSASVVYPAPTPYSLSKRKAEEIVKHSGLNYTIIRPTLVYGERGGLEFDMYLDYLKKYPVVPFIGAGRALKRPVYVGDIIAGLIAVHGKKKTFKKTYNFSGAEALSIRQFSKLCLKLLGLGNKPIVSIPVSFCMIIAKIMARIMKDPPLKWQVIAGITQDANLDPSSAMEDLGYCPAKVSERLPKCFPRSSSNKA
jgi:nucleoside-diphosphate-sugar epimerase